MATTDDDRPDDDVPANLDGLTLPADLLDELNKANLSPELIDELDEVDAVEAERLLGELALGNPGARDAILSLIRRRAEEAEGTDYHERHEGPWRVLPDDPERPVPKYDIQVGGHNGGDVITDPRGQRFVRWPNGDIEPLD
jgi:hypothetical protein